MAAESSEAPQTCGCKGIRYCSACIDTERVKRLRAEGDPYSEYSVFVFSASRGCAVRCDALSSSASLEEIQEATTKVSQNVQESDESISVDGLLLIHDFLTEEEESSLVETIDKKEWALSQSGRRKQDYGPQVNFKHKKVKTTRFVGMPDYADLVLNKMSSFSVSKLGKYQPFELCNLEYNDERMSAIEMHQDDMWIWGNRLISLNLINGSVMTLVNESTRQLLYVLMPRRSLLCMADDARYKWKHGVYSKHIRGRRIALTMREPAPAFQEGGELYEKFGKELIRLGNLWNGMTNKSSKLYFNAEKEARKDQTDDAKRLAKKTHKALRQLHRHDPDIEVSDVPTKNVFVANSSVLCGVRPESLVSIFRAIDEDCKCTVFQSTRNYSFVEFSDVDKAQSALEALHGTIPIQVQDDSNHAFYMAYVTNLPEIKQKECEKPAGMDILADFVTELEEKELIELVDSYPSSSSSSSSNLASLKTPIKHRHVLHFGSVFDYDTNSAGAGADTVPESISAIIDRLIESGLIDESERPDQVTVNFYEPNQEKPTGIPPHVDAHSPFEEPIISLSLQSKVVMDFRDCANPNVHIPLVLEPRSLLVMRGAARYRFTHGIATRRYDAHPATGDVFDRQRRISITFRRIRKEPCQCPFIEYCDWDRNGQTALPKTSVEAKKIEDRYVAEIYETIASHFDETRHSKWNAVSNFLESLRDGSFMFDIGCGNGKYLFDDSKLIKFGMDYCMNLCEIVQQKGFNIVRGDSLNLPFKSEAADAVLCIAVIHHFSTPERRLQAVSEMGRILKPGGKGIITVWSMDQKKSFFQEYREKRDLDGSPEPQSAENEANRLLVHSGSVFKQSDMLVPWQDGSGTQYLRYYHLFQEGELEGLVEAVDGLKVYSAIHEQGNWIVSFEKN